jgi:hypothetical protein
MGLQDALRKAAGLLVELPPESSSERTTQLLNDTSSPTETANLSVDELLAATDPSRARQSTAAGRGAPKTVEQIVRDADGPNLDEIKIDPSIGAGKPGDKAIEPSAIYTAAKLPATPFSAEQMLEMLAGLPRELPLDTRRATVKVTLGALGKTMGATPETIVADASRKIAALAAYGEHLKKRTEELVLREEAEIEALQAQIENKRKTILDARNQLAQSSQQCQAESERLDDVLEFFSLDVPPSKYAASGGGTPSAANA